MILDGASTFDMQAAILAELGMGESQARQWLSDTWLLAERSDATDSDRGASARTTGTETILAGVYRELEAIERLERARILRAALRFEVRRTRQVEEAGGKLTPADDLRAAALDLLLPCRMAGEGSRSPSRASGEFGASSYPQELAKVLRREATRPISERLFGPRGSSDMAQRRHRNRVDRDGLHRGPRDILDAICGAAVAEAIDVRPPSVEDALWGLTRLASTLDPEMESSIEALECRLVLGAHPSQPDFEDTDRRRADRSAPVERIELAQLVVSGRFGEALDRSSAGELREDASPSLGALRAALRHRLKETASVPDSLNSKRPGPAEIRRIARFLISMDGAWPSQQQGRRRALAAHAPGAAALPSFPGWPSMMESGS